MKRALCLKRKLSKFIKMVEKYSFLKYFRICAIKDKLVILSIFGYFEVHFSRIGHFLLKHRKSFKDFILHIYKIMSILGEIMKK